MMEDYKDFPRWTDDTRIGYVYIGHNAQSFVNDIQASIDKYPDKEIQVRKGYDNDIELYYFEPEDDASYEKRYNKYQKDRKDKISYLERQLAQLKEEDSE